MIEGPTHAQNMLSALTQLNGRRVLAIGDVILDIFAYGTVSRISPEAPVPVMRLSRETAMLGGVGNVACNIAALDGEAVLVAMVGADESGRVLESLLETHKAVRGHLLRSSERQTTTKRRFIASAQQMLRVDQEDVAEVGAPDETRLVEHIRAAMVDVSAIILSDYGKGTLTRRILEETIKGARERGIPVLVDPKHRDMRRYGGATCITPNAGELALATGLPTDTDADVEKAARALSRLADAQFVLTTRSEKGMSLVRRDGDTVHLRAHKRAVFDVSGAGDTVIGTLALALAGGVDWASAASLANYAAGVVVGKPGTATCSLSELEHDISQAPFASGTKLQEGSQASKIVAQWRRSGLRVGFTNGCFDLLHSGHVSLLQKSRAACDRLVVGLNSDASVKRLKGEARPLQNAASRAAVLAALSSVDLVVVFDEDTPIDLIEALRPSILMKGADYTLDQVVGADLVIADGGEVKLIDLVDGQSTTNIISRMARDRR